MKAPPFQYHRPATLGEAVEMLASLGDDAKILAGGQSLMPVMAMRLGQPAHLVDIGSIPGLADITVADNGVVSLGPLVRHEQAKRSPMLAVQAPMIGQAMRWVAHRAIRTQGTVLGSIAHADPAAEMPAVVLATEATLVATSTRGEREIAANDFFHGFLTTALAADEILTSVRFPAWSPQRRSTVVEVARRSGDYALVGLAASVTLDETGTTITEAALSFFGVGSTAMRATAAEDELRRKPATAESYALAAAAVKDTLTPPSDVHATRAYRCHVAGELTKQALTTAIGEVAAKPAAIKAKRGTQS